MQTAKETRLSLIACRTSMRNIGLDAVYCDPYGKIERACLKHQTPYFTSSSFMIFSIGLET